MVVAITLDQRRTVRQITLLDLCRLALSFNHAVSNSCKTKFAELATTLPSPNYIIFKLSDDNISIVVDDSGKTSKYGDFTAKLLAADCRWAVYNNFLSGNEKDSFKYSKPKMAYVSSKAMLKSTLSGIAVEISTSESSEITYDSVVKKL
ncbi:twinstar-like protein [Nemania sp. NC0429]|nr:twinstar-like protein [Nemania sp. NC0429]